MDESFHSAQGDHHADHRPEGRCWHRDRRTRDLLDQLARDPLTLDLLSQLAQLQVDRRQEQSYTPPPRATTPHTWPGSTIILWHFIILNPLHQGPCGRPLAPERFIPSPVPTPSRSRKPTPIPVPSHFSDCMKMTTTRSSIMRYRELSVLIDEDSYIRRKLSWYTSTRLLHQEGHYPHRFQEPPVEFWQVMMIHSASI